MILAFRDYHIKNIEISEYNELSVNKIWPQSEENKELLNCNLDFNGGELTERDHFYEILTTLYEDEVKQLIVNPRKAKAQVKPESREGLVEFDPFILKEIESVIEMKSNVF